MRTKLFRLLWVALLSLSGVLPAAATDYLPLAVGNSWTYDHEYYDLTSNEGLGIDQYSAYMDQWPGPDEPFLLPEFTIEVLNTEVIDGKTYYVLSDMPANWPPAPPHFIAGKKLRWEGTHLMERTADGERSVFRFDGVNDASYTVETDEGDLLVKTIVYWRGINRMKDLIDPVISPVNFYDFRLYPPRLALAESQGCGFTENYGCVVCDRAVLGGPSTLSETREQEVLAGSETFENSVVTLRAVLEGRPVVYKDLFTPTSISPSSWGQVKEEAQ